MKTDNEIIAEFMGAEMLLGGAYNNIPIPSNRIIIEETCLKYVEEMEYHSSWDWLMPVVGKITKTTPMNHSWYDVRYTLGDADIQGAYKRVLGFIKWYNSQLSTPKQ